MKYDGTLGGFNHSAKQEFWDNILNGEKNLKYDLTNLPRTSH
ncbi:MAG: hypothetical protein AABX77_02515 [Nanoarchaeota archaeon]